MQEVLVSEGTPEASINFSRVAPVVRCNIAQNMAPFSNELIVVLARFRAATVRVPRGKRPLQMPSLPELASGGPECELTWKDVLIGL